MKKTTKFIEPINFDKLNGKTLLTSDVTYQIIWNAIQRHPDWAYLNSQILDFGDGITGVKHHTLEEYLTNPVEFYDSGLQMMLVKRYENLRDADSFSEQITILINTMSFFVLWANLLPKIIHEKLDYGLQLDIHGTAVTMFANPNQYSLALSFTINNPNFYNCDRYSVILLVPLEYPENEDCGHIVIGVIDRNKVVKDPTESDVRSAVKYAGHEYGVGMYDITKEYIKGLFEKHCLELFN